MSKKELELETRNIMQGLEEFATFISFNSDLSGMRILSVESVEQHPNQDNDIAKAQLIAMPINRIKAKKQISPKTQQIYKSLAFK